jgi:predicted  nucleic acid-binding Zn-ribbon protein
VSQAILVDASEYQVLCLEIGKAKQRGEDALQRIADLERENARLTAIIQETANDSRKSMPELFADRDAFKIECEGLHKLLTKAHGVVESAALGALSRSVDARRLFTILLEEMDAARKGGK